ncbi:MAG: alpha/beta fold hydrolase [Saprospiraceae bacterium]
MQYTRCYFLFLALIFVSAQALHAQEITFEGLKSVNGTALYCKVIGKGEPLLVLHGGPGLSHDYFLPHLLPLAKRYQLILVDQRAQGRSSQKLDSTQVTMQAMVDDVEGIRQAFKLGKIHLLAHSWGGNIAIRYAAQYPQSLQSLILVNVVPLNPTAFEEKMRQMPPKSQHPQDSLERVELFASESFKKREPAAIEKLMILNFRRTAYDRSNMDKLRLNIQPGANNLLRYLGPDAMTYDLTDTAKKITAPTLVIHGAADLIPLESDLQIQRTVANGSLEQFFKSGHFPFVEEPKKFNRTIQAWIRQH